MRSTWLTGGSRIRLMVPVVSLLLALGLAAALAYQAILAERSYRRVARDTLEDYADFAAYILGSRVFGTAQSGIGAELNAVRAVAIGDAPPASLDTLLVPCATDPERRPRWAFHLDFEQDRFEAWGPVSPTVAAWARDTLRIDSRRDELARFPFTHVFGRVADEPVALVYGAQRDAWDQPVRAFGLSPCFERGDRSVFQLSLSGPSALPPTLTETLPNDSTLSVRVVDPWGGTVWQSSGPFSEAYAGSSGVWGPFGGIQLQASLRPEVTGRLVSGGVPRSRLPVTLGLLSLAAILVLAALFQLRREHELVRLREAFVSSVSHELRTPLQQVLLFVELLRMKKLRTEEEETRSLRIVEEETQRLIQLVENLLQFSRAGRGETRVNPRPVDLEPVVRETVEAFAPLARAGKARVDCVTVPSRALADRDAVHRILLNLLDNAVKYGPPGQTVRVSLAPERRSVVLKVRDQGPGVAAEDRARIWEAFYRGRGEGESRTGSGIGLSIVRELVALQGGEVGLENGAAGDRGACFVVALPSADQPEPRPTEATPRSARPGGGAS